MIQDLRTVADPAGNDAGDEDLGGRQASDISPHRDDGRISSKRHFAGRRFSLILLAAFAALSLPIAMCDGNNSVAALVVDGQSPVTERLIPDP